jgi:hypothetical protein
MEKLTERNTQRDIPILVAAGLLNQAMSSIQLHNWAFTVVTDPVVTERCQVQPEVIHVRESFATRDEWQEAFNTAYIGLGHYDPLDILQEMTPTEINELQKRVIAREARRTNVLQFI